MKAFRQVTIRCGPALWALFGMGTIPPSTAAEKHSGPSFETTVAPILENRCHECHGGGQRKGELDLSSAAGIARGGESGPAFVAGEVAESHLYELVESGKMPKEGDPLPDEEIDAIRAWIEGGARFEDPPKVAENTMNQHDVLPILLLRCTACHGRRKQDGGLQLHTPAAILEGGDGGPALVAGDPDASPMIRRIESNACPPKGKLLDFFVERPPSSEVETLREWIAAGAPVEDVAPDVATTEPDPLVSEEDRQHWAFQPPRKPSDGPDSIDGFVGAKLRENDLDFSPEADRDTLIRRAYLDLVGLPPSVEEWRYWRESDDPDWYAAMIDDLLASPHYGERWGRYWLDLAGYADSEGGVSADPVREVAWKYRDYVIESFNEDEPYDRFLLEQLAGDELIDHENAEEITDRMVENLVATGFLRMGIDQTGSRTMNFVPERLGVIDDALEVVGSSIMGLTMECARCHSHKYDPLPQRDYFRLKAVFQGALDEHDWMSFKTRSLEVGTAAHRRRIAETNPPVEKELKSLENRLKRTERDLRRAVMRHHYPDLSEEDVEETLVALRKASNQRTLPQRRLVEQFRVAKLRSDDGQPESVLAGRREVAELERSVDRKRDELVPPLTIRALWDRGRPSPTYILRRGEYNKPGRLVGPGVPSALTDGRTPFEVEPPFPEGTDKTGRRLAFARWLTRPDHPLTARVMVNRIWHHHFGTGLVETLENFGVKGGRPSHPGLLDWLAVQFVERDWSIKDMHRLIMNSRAYRQSSHVTDRRREIDPQNRLVSRMSMQRMDAETLRDSLLAVSGKLDDTRGGPPDPVTVDRDGLVSVDPTPSGGWRRSVYAQYRRTRIPTMMATFDYPAMGPNCVERSVSTVSPQALMLLNNRRVRELAEAFAGRVERRLEREGADSPTASPGEAVDAVYRLALSRPPEKEERRLGIDALGELKKKWRGAPGRALETYCHTVLNSAAFVYVD